MLDRQRGAAHVPVIVFLLTLILFFGALGFGYVVLEKNSDIEKEIATARLEKKDLENKLFFMEHYVQDITEEIGESGEWAGRQGFDYSQYGNPAPLQNVALPKGVQNRIAEFARTAGVSSAKGISAFFGHVEAELTSRASRITSLESEQKRLEGNLADLQTSLDTIKGERDSEVAQLNSNLQAKDDEYTAAIDGKTDLLAKQTAAYGTVREELTTAKEEHRQERKRLNGEIEVRNARIAAVSSKLKLINPPQAADAMVLEASQAAGRAWINIGRRDMLPVGTSFRITSADTDEVKAYGTVSKVENSRAELIVNGLKDRYDPVVRGDEVHNDLYSPNVRRNVYLLGRFGHPYSKPMVKRILENLGNTVADSISPQVDLVIVGNDAINEDGSGFTPVTETDDYKNVLRLGIETATLHKVRDFLKLSD